MPAGNLRRTLVTAALIGAALATTTVATAQAQTTAPSQLAVLTAGGGTLKDGVLTLRRVSPTATWFEDRPFHKAGIESTWTLVPGYFKAAAPPNAAIEITGRDGRADTVIVELTKPKVDAARRTLRFAARVLPQESEGMAGWRERRIAAPPRTFGRVSVFLDSDFQSCAGYVTLPAGVTGANEQTISSYGGNVMQLPFQLGPGRQQLFTQQGGFSDGCGATITYDLAQADGSGAPVPGGATGTLTLTWSNPQNGSNKASCSTTYPGVSCNVDYVSGEAPTWEFVVES